MDRKHTGSVMIENLFKKLIPVHFLLNRYAVTLFNVAVVIILSLSLWDIGKILIDNSSETEEIQKVMDGVGAFIVSYGIVLEEREGIMQIFGYYPLHKYKKEVLTDQICYEGGIILLVIGLLVEVIAQFVQIPNTVVDTEGREQILYSIGAILMIITILHFLVFCYKLLTLKHKQPSEESNN